MPQETKVKPELSDGAGAAASNTGATERTLFGSAFEGLDEAGMMDALENAFDYRGDVTVTVRADARGGKAEQVTGYLFDRERGGGLADSSVRIMTPEGVKRTVTYDRIARVEFTGKDAAHGKSWETWVKKYVEKKRAGEHAEM